MKIKDLRPDVKEHVFKLIKKENKSCYVGLNKEEIENIDLNRAFSWSVTGLNYEVWSRINVYHNYELYDKFFKVNIKTQPILKLYL